MVNSHTRWLFISIMTILLSTQAFAVSVQTNGRVEDPFSSESLLAGKDFTIQLTEAERQLSEKFSVQLSVIGKGDPLYVWFGHTGLVVNDGRDNRKIMYDYGIFSFRSGFYKSFIMGRLLYEVWATNAEARFRQTVEENRSARLIDLQLDPSAKLELIRFLNFNTQTENQQYLYHHYYANCSTRIRDVIDKAVDGQFRTWALGQPSPYTIRQDVMRHTAPYPFIDWALNFLQGGAIDKPVTLWERMFIPEVLEQAVLDFHYTNEQGKSVALASAVQSLHVQSDSSVRPPVLSTYRPSTIYWFVGSTAAGLIVLIMKILSTITGSRGLRLLFRFLFGFFNWGWTLATGFAGSLLLFMMLFTTHDYSYWNENIIFVNPLLLVMSIQSLRIIAGKPKALKRFENLNGFLALVTLIVMMAKVLLPEYLIQANWQIILTMLPLYLSNAPLKFERNRKQKESSKRRDGATLREDSSDFNDL
ncbi:MAG: DUF4105 domain-containing protein [Sphaerochaetaceae bacterium]|nr:DUF4105 domain-containing protein [Sphaerochaetaceae bacterium]MDX9808618.1 DUF4105 domain-containing protein [Sphaerochaetaceae bacterium]